MPEFHDEIASRAIARDFASENAKEKKQPASLADACKRAAMSKWQFSGLFQKVPKWQPGPGGRTWGLGIAPLFWVQKFTHPTSLAATAAGILCFLKKSPLLLEMFRLIVSLTR